MGCIFLSVFMIPQIAQNSNVAWMNYALCGSTLIAIPLVLFTKEKYVRSDLDAPTDTSHSRSILPTPYSDNGVNDTVFRSSNVPYSVMQ